VTKPFNPDASVYCLALRHQQFETVSVGALGKVDWPEGWLYYAGRASRGWSRRFKRFVKDHTTPFWHIDYLLNSSRAVRVGAFIFPIEADRECEVSQRLSEVEGLSALAERLGSSDCEAGCKAHAWEGPVSPKQLRRGFFNRSPAASGWINFQERLTRWIPRNAQAVE